VPRPRLTAEVTAFVREVRRLLLALTGCVGAVGLLALAVSHLVKLLMTLAGY
jgi:hypothetical protein